MTRTRQMSRTPRHRAEPPAGDVGLALAVVPMDASPREALERHLEALRAPWLRFSRATVRTARTRTTPARNEP